MVVAHLGMIRRRPVASDAGTPGPHRVEPWLWLGAEAAVLFTVPWVGVDLLDWEPDLYYVVYFSVAVLFTLLFVGRHRRALRRLWRRRPLLSLSLGAVMGVLVAASVLREDATGHPGGARFAVEVVWRGPVYGLVDATMLFVLPAAVVFLALRPSPGGSERRLAFAALALASSVLVTAVYHLGYPEFRGSTLRYPEIGAVAANVPTVVAGNPVGALVTHVTAHTTAVVHEYDGGSAHMLPPRSAGDHAARGSSDLGLGLAVAWMAAAVAGGAWALRRTRS